MSSKPRFVGDGQLVELGSICELVMGQSPSSDTYNADGEGLPFYQGNADFGEKNPIPHVWCTEPKKVAEKGDILISVRAPIGAINIASEQCCIGRGVAAIKPRLDFISADFLMHQLLASRKKLELMGTGSTFKAVGKKALNGFAISIYPKGDQDIIADQLDCIIQQIKATETQVVQLDQLVKSRFVEMFESEDYGMRPMGDLVESVTAGTNVGGQQRPLGEGEYGVLKISAVTQGVFNPGEFKVVDDVSHIKMIHPRKGDLLFSRANTSEMVGATAIVDKDYGDLFLPDKLWRLDPTDEVETVFLKALLSSPSIRAEMSKVSTGSSGSMQNISMAKFRKLPAFLPPLALQQEFAAFASQVDKSRFIAQQQIEKLQMLYDSLAQDYFGD